MIFSVVFALLSLHGYVVIFFLEPTKFVLIAHFIINSIFVLMMTLIVISAVGAHRITLDTLLGAVCGYLLVGLTWSYFYLTVASMDPNAFSYHMLDGTFRDKIQHFIYFSFESLTTLGLGDIVPLTDTARALTWLEAATGQIFLAVWISQLVALLYFSTY